MNATDCNRRWLRSQNGLYSLISTEICVIKSSRGKKIRRTTRITQSISDTDYNRWRLRSQNGLYGLISTEIRSVIKSSRGSIRRTKNLSPRIWVSLNTNEGDWEATMDFTVSSLLRSEVWSNRAEGRRLEGPRSYHPEYECHGLQSMATEKLEWALQTHLYWDLKCDQFEQRDDSKNQEVITQSISVTDYNRRLLRSHDGLYSIISTEIRSMIKSSRGKKTRRTKKLSPRVWVSLITIEDDWEATMNFAVSSILRSEVWSSCAEGRRFEVARRSPK